MLKNLILVLLLFIALHARGETILLTSDNHVFIRGEVSAKSMREAAIELVNLHIDRKDVTTPLYIVLNSPGGSVFAGEEFIQLAKKIPNTHTVTIFAASMAHAIVQSLPGTRYIVDNGMFMAHRAKATFSGQFNPGEVESTLEVLSKFINRIEERIADRIGISFTKYKKKIMNEWWTEAVTSIDENIADEIIDLDCSKELFQNVKTESIQTLFGEVEESYSACPIMP